MGSAHAQGLLLIGVGGEQTTAAGYAGVGDVKAGWWGWWGFRAYSSATRGNKAINLCLPSDTNCEDESTDATTGLLVLGAFGSTCNTSTVICTVKTFYDQTGNGHDETQATIANRNTFDPVCGSAMCVTGVGTTGTGYATAATFTQTQPFAVQAVALAATGHSTNSSVFEDDSFNWTTLFGSTPNFWGGYAGSLQQIAQADNTFQALGATFNGASGILSVNTTQSTQNMGTNGSSSNSVSLMGLTNGSLPGSFREGGVYPGALSNSDYSAIYNNQHTWGQV